MNVIADVFWKFWTPKNVVRQVSKNSRLTRLFDKQHGKQSETLGKSERQICLRNKFYFLSFFFVYVKSRLNFEIFQKTVILIADVFAKLQTPRNGVRYLSKKPRFRRHFDSQPVNGLKLCCNLNDSSFTIFIDH